MNTQAQAQRVTEQAVLEEARKVNEQRMKSVEVLARLVAGRRELEARLKENAKQQRRAIREAKKAGWTTAQIKRLVNPPKSPQQMQEPQHSDAEVAIL